MSSNNQPRKSVDAGSIFGVPQASVDRRRVKKEIVFARSYQTDEPDEIHHEHTQDEIPGEGDSTKVQVNAAAISDAEKERIMASFYPEKKG